MCDSNGRRNTTLALLCTDIHTYIHTYIHTQILPHFQSLASRSTQLQHHCLAHPLHVCMCMCIYVHNSSIIALPIHCMYACTCVRMYINTYINVHNSGIIFLDVCICIYIHTYINTYTCSFVQVASLPVRDCMRTSHPCMCMHIHKYIHMFVFACTRLHAHITSMYVHGRKLDKFTCQKGAAYMHSYTHTLMHARIHAYIHTYIHTMVDFGNKSRLLNDGKKHMVYKYRKEGKRSLSACMRVCVCAHACMLVFICMHAYL